MNITALTVFVALVGFAIAAGPALVVILMDLGKEQHAKTLEQQTVTSPVYAGSRENALIS
jgi:hypothetical protein